MEAEPRDIAPDAELAPLAAERAHRPRDFRVQKDIGNHYLDFTPNGDDLVVTFDADDLSPDPRHLPWGFRSLREQGLAVLGVKMKRADWYRGPALQDFFRSPDLHFLLGAYRRVLFTGASMGGFGALTFCTPGALVLAHHPPTTLDPELTPWDTRFPEARQLDWSGPFARAEEGAAQAARVFVTYDPFEAMDRRHVDRLDPANLVRLKAPMLGNPLPNYLRRIGLLAELAPMALSGELTAEWWHGAIRKRRDLARYHLIMADHIKAPERAAMLMARAWKLSADDRRTQDRIRRHAAVRKLTERFEHHLVERAAPMAAGPEGPDQELFRRLMAVKG